MIVLHGYPELQFFRAPSTGDINPLTTALQLIPGTSLSIRTDVPNALVEYRAMVAMVGIIAGYGVCIANITDNVGNVIATTQPARLGQIAGVDSSQPILGYEVVATPGTITRQLRAMKTVNLGTAQATGTGGYSFLEAMVRQSGY